MFKTGHKKAQASAGKSAGQAAVELAVFGAVLIFLLGTIVRSAMSTSNTQNKNFMAMRMAMLASWTDSRNSMWTRNRNTQRNSASVVILEDRLSPDFNKYGDLDREPLEAQGSGTFSENLLFPLSEAADVMAGLPIQDIYINGQHFPFQLASYVRHRPLVPPNTPGIKGGTVANGGVGLSAAICQGMSLNTDQNKTNFQQPTYTCQENQCWRNLREWVGNSYGLVVKVSEFNKPLANPKVITAPACQALGKRAEQRQCQQRQNACAIFNLLNNAGMFANTPTSNPPEIVTGTCTGSPSDNMQGTIGVPADEPLDQSQAWLWFSGNSTTSGADSTKTYQLYFTYNTAHQNKLYLDEILSMLKGTQYPYKLFYTRVVNAGGTIKTNHFSTNPPACAAHPCKDQELSDDAPLLGYMGNPTTDGATPPESTNINGVMEYDLLRNADYSSTDAPGEPNKFGSIQPGGVLYPTQFPTCSQGGDVNCLRNYISWQWAATAASGPGMIGLNTDQNTYPTYDIDGRLKEVTIFGLDRPSNITYINYEDSEGGDLDQTWDSDSCGPKPGIQPDSAIYTYTQNGTYLKINEGKLYNPETGQVVRSANKRDSIDLIQRTIQLSNNTGRFCNLINNKPLNYVGDICPRASSYVCPDTGVACLEGEVCGNGKPCPEGSSNCDVDPSAMIQFPQTVLVPNPVKVCVAETSSTDNCFTQANIVQTCYDTKLNVIYVRSLIQDQRGHFWMTNASGALKVQ